jgi:hypothetical protein
MPTIEALHQYRNELENEKFDTRLKLEEILSLIEDASGALGVRKNFRHNDITNDFTGSEDDENAIDSAIADLARAIKLLKPIAGY